ncbi:hypothetical protein BJ878DRAFT_512504 [Calycina marina]|uniref:Uncharacterized protein n=1 Tax=Calycina marina TaxID=1763456 RepID=A0A9P8CDS8_9HELO|nr:hypothetical protein BJ878DRAFT_512504 [Calycina marina]
MSAASQNQSNFGAGTTFGAGDSTTSSEATPGGTVGSATAAGQGDHPTDNADETGVEMPSSKFGPPKEDLKGEQMASYGEGEVMDAQLDKKNAGWGEEGSYTSDLDRQKAEQKGARDDIKSARAAGESVDGGAGGRTQNEGFDSV